VWSSEVLEVRTAGRASKNGFEMGSNGFAGAALLIWKGLVASFRNFVFGAKPMAGLAGGRWDVATFDKSDYDLLI
jgi:hypothetical protein